MDRDKKQMRKLKRTVKKAGNKKRRRQLKDAVRDHPDEAHWTEPTFGNASSQTLNGLDQDSTRRDRKTSEPEA